MLSNNQKLIAVIGATGQQGGGVVRALQASGGQFKVRALTRNPDKHRELAEEVVEADLDQPETLNAAFEGAHGVFLVTSFDARARWEQGTNELKQATAAVRAAKDSGIKHFIWSTLPDVEAISGGKFNVPHFTGKAKIDRIVKEWPRGASRPQGLRTGRPRILLAQAGRCGRQGCAYRLCRQERGRGERVLRGSNGGGRDRQWQARRAPVLRSPLLRCERFSIPTVTVSSRSTRAGNTANHRASKFQRTMITENL